MVPDGYEYWYANRDVNYVPEISLEPVDKGTLQSLNTQNVSIPTLFNIIKSYSQGVDSLLSTVSEHELLNLFAAQRIVLGSSPTLSLFKMNYLWKFIPVANSKSSIPRPYGLTPRMKKLVDKYVQEKHLDI